MVQAPTPVDGNVRVPLVELHSTLYAPPSIAPAELKQSIKDRAVLSHVEVDQLLLHFRLQAKKSLSSQSLQTMGQRQSHLHSLHCVSYAAASIGRQHDWNSRLMTR